MQKTAHTIVAPAASSCLAAAAETVLAFLKAAARNLRLDVAPESVLPMGAGDQLKVSLVFFHSDVASGVAFVQVIRAVEQLAQMTTADELTKVLGIAAGDISVMQKPTAADLLSYLTPEAARTMLGSPVPEAAPVPDAQLTLAAELESESP